MAAEREDIDPEGDVLLLLRAKEKTGLLPQPQGRLRVSAKALSLASPVFKAMLSPRFLKKEPSSEGLVEVPLPDDDPEALTLLCRILHLRSRNVEISSFHMFKNLSLLCDKYDATEAFMPWSTNCYLKQQYSFPSPSWMSEQSNIGKSLYVAYGFKNVSGFALATHKFLLGCSEKTLSDDDLGSTEYDVLPADFTGTESMLDTRSQLKWSIQTLY